MRYGYFDDDHREYAIERPDVPVSWTNCLGVRDLCTVISHNAGGCTFGPRGTSSRRPGTWGATKTRAGTGTWRRE